MESKESEVHTKLAAFFAKRIVEIEARQQALEIALSQMCKVDIEQLAREVGSQQVACRPIVESRFLRDLENDPELAWLAPQVSELLH